MPDVRPIDANALLRKLQEQQKYSSVSDSRGRAKAILEVIDATTIDAQPVKRGKWVDYGSGVGLYCSECRHRIRYRNGIRETTKFSDGKFEFVQYTSKNGYYNFCPKCGAKMDGGAE